MGKRSTKTAKGLIKWGNTSILIFERCFDHILKGFKLDQAQSIVASTKKSLGFAGGSLGRTAKNVALEQKERLTRLGSGFKVPFWGWLPDPELVYFKGLKLVLPGYGGGFNRHFILGLRDHFRSEVLVLFLLRSSLIMSTPVCDVSGGIHCDWVAESLPRPSLHHLNLAACQVGDVREP